MIHSSPSVLLIFDFFDDGGKPERVCFSNPLEIIVAHSVDEVCTALQAVQQAADDGFYTAGYVAYEAAHAFDSAYVADHDATIPLLWFGIFDKPMENAPVPTQGKYHLSTWMPSVDRSVYNRRVETVREAIARGDTYQVNYTFRLRAQFEGDDFAFYKHLHRAQRTRYGAYLNIGRYRILSVSPELFFRRQGSQILTRPMKGTVRRGRWCEEDDRLSAWLATSEKDRAENVMIVDLLRNDLGRIAEMGSVQTPSLFEIECYPTVFQMTSTVTAKMRPATTLEEIFAALFPCGSVTGAPKISTMRLINLLEDSARNVYCGAIGVVKPQGLATFNVAIRTVLIDTQTSMAEYGVGGGITWESSADTEYREALSKAALLTEDHTMFELLETMLLEDARYHLLEEHLERLAASAKYFDVPLSIESVRWSLEEHAKQVPTERRRARLLVSQDGRARIESVPLDPLPSQPLTVMLARTPVSTHDRFLFHKTTQRAVYDIHRAQCPTAFDVLLWNEKDELTEFTTGNLVVEVDGRRWTPFVESGLLAGTFRAKLLRLGEIRERTLTHVDIERASRCWLINSVRGWIEVSFEGNNLSDEKKEKHSNRVTEGPATKSR